MKNNQSSDQIQSAATQSQSSKFWQPLTVAQQEVTKGGYYRRGIIMPPNRRGTPGGH